MQEIKQDMGEPQRRFDETMDEFLQHIRGMPNRVTIRVGIMFVAALTVMTMLENCPD